MKDEEDKIQWGKKRRRFNEQLQRERHAAAAHEQGELARLREYQDKRHSMDRDGNQQRLDYMRTTLRKEQEEAMRNDINEVGR